MDFPGGHLTLVVLGRGYPVGSHEGEQVVLDNLEVLELLIEMAGQQQHGVFELALAAAQRPLAEITGHDGRPDRDCGDQQDAAEDQPADRAAAKGGRDLEPSGAD